MLLCPRSFSHGLCGVCGQNPECVWIPCPGGWKSAQGHWVSLKFAMELAGDGNTLLCPWDMGEVKPSTTVTAPCVNNFIQV